MLQKDVRSFLNSKMNLDADPRYLQVNEHLEIYNSILSIAEDSKIGCLAKMKGTINAFSLAVNTGFTPPAATLKCVGVAEDTETQSVVVMLMDTVGTNHGIFRMFLSDYTCQWILHNKSELNFKKYIANPVVSDTELYWTDGYEGTPFVDYNEPMNIDLVRAAGYTNTYSASNTYSYGFVVGYTASGITKCYRYINTTPSSQVPTNTAYWEDTGLMPYNQFWYTNLPQIQQPPVAPILAPSGQTVVLKAKYSQDSLYKANFLRGKLWQFAIKYVRGKKHSVWSDYSEMPLSVASENGYGGWNGDVTVDNTINITFFTNTQDVTEFVIAFREGNTGVWKLLDHIYKYDADGTKKIEDINSTPPVYTYTVNFKNDIVGTPLDQAEVLRMYDDLPQVAETLELIDKNRLVWANFKKDFDPVKIDVKLDYKYALADPFNGYNASFVLSYDATIQIETVSTSPKKYIWASWFTVDLAPYFRPGCSFSISMKDESGTMRYVTTYIDPKETILEFVPRIAQLIGHLPDCPQSTTIGDEGVHSFAAMQGQAGYETYLYVRIRENMDATHNPPGGIPHNTNLPCTISQFTSISQPTFKTGAWHYFALGYTDEYGRAFPINTSKQSKVYIPTVNELKNIGTRWIASTVYKYDDVVIYLNVQYIYIYNTPTSGNLPTNTTYWKLYNGYNLGKMNNYAYLSWGINHTPPMGAAYAQWYYGGSSMSYFFDFEIPVINETTAQENIEVMTPKAGGTLSRYVQVPLNTELSKTKDAFKSNVIPNYVWQKGDRIRFVCVRKSDTVFDYIVDSSGNPLDREILAADYNAEATPYQPYLHDQSKANEGDGDYILDEHGNKKYDTGQVMLRVEYFDPDAYWGYWKTTDSNIMVEVYRPRKGDEDEIVYHAYGRRMPVVYPNTANRVHGYGERGIPGCLPPVRQNGDIPATGFFIGGNAYVKKRHNSNVPYPTQFWCESSYYSDFYKSDYYSQGRPFIVNRYAKRTHYTASLCWGGTYNPLTNINRMCSVDSSDFIDLERRYGGINYLKQVGYTLKVLQTAKPTSIMVGRAELTQTGDGEPVTAATKNVFSLPKPHDSSYGTMHPTSCLKFESHLYWYDVNAGCILRDGNNGIFAISSYGLEDFIQKKSVLFRQNGVDVYSAYDVRSDLVLFTFRDKTDSANDFTLGFVDAGQQVEGWISFYSFLPDFYLQNQSELLAYKGGAWNFNSSTYCNFFGTQYDSWVTVVSNKEPLLPKRFIRLLESSNKVFSSPTAGDIYIPPTGNNLTGMKSLLKAGAFTTIEGKWCADYGRNMVTNDVTPSMNDLVNGEDLRGQFMTQKLINSDTTDVKLFSVEIDSIL